MVPILAAVICSWRNAHLRYESLTRIVAIFQKIWLRKFYVKQIYPTKNGKICKNIKRVIWWGLDMKKQKEIIYQYETIFDPNGAGYTVTIPKLPGLVTEGDTLKVAREMAKDGSKTIIAEHQVNIK